MKLTKALVEWLVDKGHCVPDGSDSYYKSNAAKLLASGGLSATTYSGLIEDEEEMRNSHADPDVDKLFSGDGGDRIRVKAPSERYSTKRYTATNKYGKAVLNPIHGGECQTQSQRDAAMAGVLFKHTANKAGVVNNPLTEHERDLLNELCHDQPWCGHVNGEWYDYIGGSKSVKALIDDATSGGLEIAPIAFDEMVVTFPLLHGELMPQVDVHPVPRGRRIEGASIATPTASWGGFDDTAVALFDTSSLVNAIDTTIFRIETAVRVGLDFLSDSPTQVGTVLTALVGERFMEELDKVIGNGNGTTQPEGIFQKSGISTVTWSGATTINNYEALLFAVAKQYRRDAFRPIFVANDTTYQRARAIPVGASDVRRIFGMDEESYMLLDRPYKIQNDLANTVAAFGCGSKYRLYRRKGTEIRWANDGDTLSRRNETLLLAFGRYGGQVIDANAWAKTTDAAA